MLGHQTTEAFSLVGVEKVSLQRVIWADAGAPDSLLERMWDVTPSAVKWLECPSESLRF